MKAHNSAFTLIELLVVMAIIAILCALLFPALKAANSARNESVALSNMHQIGTAFTLYAGDNSFLLPSRMTTASGATKWPGLLASYLSNVRVYASSYDLANWIILGLTTAQALGDTANDTSFIMNRYNGLGTMTTAVIPPPLPPRLRIDTFASASNVILLGTPKNPTVSNPTVAHNTQFYMDFGARRMATNTTCWIWPLVTVDRITSLPTARQSS